MSEATSRAFVRFTSYRHGWEAGAGATSFPQGTDEDYTAGWLVGREARTAELGKAREHYGLPPAKEIQPC